MRSGWDSVTTTSAEAAADQGVSIQKLMFPKKNKILRESK